MKRVTLLDYGVGNIHSLRKGLENAGLRVRVTTSARELLKAGAVVLPGVGGFAAGAPKLKPVRTALRSRLREGTPCLAVCLGMQLLFEASEEARGVGIGLLPGVVRRLEHRRLPHIGWNQVKASDPAMFAGIPQNAFFYFVHSFAPSPCGDACAATSEYGRPFAAAVRTARTWGFQFHPEKSSANGMALLRNFAQSLES
jgi:glutamine amidotransferase